MGLSVTGAVGGRGRAEPVAVLGLSEGLRPLCEAGSAVSRCVTRTGPRHVRLADQARTGHPDYFASKACRSVALRVNRPFNPAGTPLLSKMVAPMAMKTRGTSQSPT
jgi:hypothetical protein